MSFAPGITVTEIVSGLIGGLTIIYVVSQTPFLHAIIQVTSGILSCVPVGVKVTHPVSSLKVVV